VNEDLEKQVNRFLHKRSIVFLIGLMGLLPAFAQSGDSTESTQINMDYDRPQKYTIAGITVSGTKYMDGNVLALLSGLTIGEQINIPGDELRNAIDRIWKQDLFADIEIYATKIEGKNIYLNIQVTERPRLSRYSIKGLKKAETKNIKEEISLRSNEIITENLINKARREILAYFHEKGFFNAKVEVKSEDDPDKENQQILRINIDKGPRVKVNEIIIVGNEHLTDQKLHRILKPKQKKKKWNIFASSRFVQEKYDETRPEILAKYQAMGYRDASIVTDSLYQVGEGLVNIYLKIEEGNKYFFRDILFSGNTKYSSGMLDTILGIKKGEIFDQSKLDTRLYMNPNGFDITSLYMDDGYLFFSVTPVEVLVENDSIDLEIRIYEGKQATINRVTVVGNDKTSDHVILRALRTRPGQKFSRSDIQRSMRELAQLNYFDPEAMDVQPTPNPADGTVDIKYIVAEKPSDQVEASGGWGGIGGFVGTIGLTLNNFSSRKMFQKGGWNPIPAGDGQQLGLRAQSNGFNFQGYSFSFTEPWLGGKKPNSFSISLFHNIQSMGRGFKDNTLTTTGGTVMLGKLLQWPDDYFTWSNSLTFQRYALRNWAQWGAEEIGFTQGIANNFAFSTVLSRNSSDHPIFPTTGSQISASLQFTPPYSAFQKNKDYSRLSAQERFRWVEYHKWKFDAKWFIKPIPNFKLVLMPQVRMGLIGLYNNDIGYSPFEQFLVGGAGLVGFTLYGTDIVSQRGYRDGRISDPRNGQNPDPIFNRYTLELRYPISMNPSATVFAISFLEAGNTWENLQSYNPFDVRRAAGVGVRLFLPMFGLIGFDYAWGFDHLPFEQKGQFHFFLGQQF